MDVGCTEKGALADPVNLHNGFVYAHDGRPHGLDHGDSKNAIDAQVEMRMQNPHLLLIWIYGRALLRHVLQEALVGNPQYGRREEEHWCR